MGRDNNLVNRILFCATVDYHFKAFHLPYMKWFKEQGWEVDIAASGNLDLPYTDNKYSIPIERSPFQRSNLSAYKQLKEIINRNNYAIIHCHTPLGGALTRIAARTARKNGTKIIYTAHGFHFCKGVSIINWLLYYPVERYLSRHTDSLITINQEDYNLAKKHHFRAREIKYISGVGVDTDKFMSIDENEKKKLKVSSGYNADDFILFNAGEFNKNKNQIFLLESMVYILQEVPNARLILAGEGTLLENCKQLADQLEISNRVTFLGFCDDVDKIIPMCDVAVAASFREGLPVNVMESMSCELPVVAVDNRGHRELVYNDINGWILTEWDEVKFANKVKTLVHDELRSRFGKHSRQIILDKYSTNQILKKKSQMYKTYMDRREHMTWIAP